MPSLLPPMYLFFVNSRYSFSSSIPMYLLFIFAATIPVVPEPLNGSSIKSFSLEAAVMSLSNSLTGFVLDAYQISFHSLEMYHIQRLQVHYQISDILHLLSTIFFFHGFVIEVMFAFLLRVNCFLAQIIVSVEW